MTGNSYKSRGVVLHTMPHGESGHIVYVYTELFGRVSYYINSGKRGVATVGGSKIMLHPLTVIEFVGSKGRGAFHRITEAKRAFASYTMFDDIYKSTISLYVAELIYKIVKEEEANSFLFEFIFQSIKVLQIIDEGKPNFHLYFTTQLTKYLGFFPSSNYQDDFYFDMSSGEFVIIRPSHPLHIDRRESKLLWQIMGSNISSLGEVKTSGKSRGELLGKMIDYLGIHHDKKYKIQSLEYFKEVF